MFKYNCLNPIAQVGLDNFDANYVATDDFADADGVLVRRRFSQKCRNA